MTYKWKGCEYLVGMILTIPKVKAVSAHGEMRRHQHPD